MTEVLRQRLEEHVIEGKRLGRHIEHDPRSRDYAYEVSAEGTLIAVEHKRHGGILDQGQIGSCTGNAAAGAHNTEPIYHSGQTHTLTETGAKDLYELATILDGFPGHYPDQDTGSSGLAVAKAMRQEGMIKSYQHAFDMDAALAALQAGPVITGISWYEGFDDPDINGLVEISGQVRGGHEIVARGYVPATNPDEALILLDNSWGTSWGVSGRFYWSVGTWKQLLADGGDVTILVP